MIGVDGPGHGCGLRNNQDAGVIGMGADVPHNLAVYAKSFRKDVIALNTTSMGNQALDGRLLLFPEHGIS
jgi:hypothetical protein